MTTTEVTCGVCVPLLVKVSKISFTVTGSKTPLFAYFVKNRLPELIVAESLTFLHREKGVFLFVCFNNLPNARQYWSAPRQFLFFSRVMKWILKEESISRKWTNW